MICYIPNGLINSRSALIEYHYFCWCGMYVSMFHIDKLINHMSILDTIDIDDTPPFQNYCSFWFFYIYTSRYDVYLYAYQKLCREHISANQSFRANRANLIRVTGSTSKEHVRLNNFVINRPPLIIILQIDPPSHCPCARACLICGRPWVLLRPVDFR